ncbi:MAG: hypothetical protein HY059_04985 [Proteobacteria bacterium]|nr:hypothetical protein [Pseudomonadota bacterium]
MAACLALAAALPARAVDAPAPAAPGEDPASLAGAALQNIAAAYTAKRRTLFMRLVSDDFRGDLGTLEDALSSDFRAYRTIDLQIFPSNVSVKGKKAQVQFSFDMTVTNDRGRNSKFGGQGAYTMIEESGKWKLYQMDRTQLFGTSLSSVENPVPKSQGAAPTPAPSAPGCNTTTESGSASIDSDIGQGGYKFETRSAVQSANGDFNYGSPDFNAGPGAGIVDMGPCNLANVTTPPASITGMTAAGVVGDCYAIRTANEKYAVIKPTSIVGNAVNFQFKFQPTGARCF